MVIVLLAAVLAGTVIGFIWAGRRKYVARRDAFEAEVGRRTLALDEREFLQGRRELELEEFQCRLEERDRDLAGQEAEMDQKQAALRERAQQVSLA